MIDQRLRWMLVEAIDNFVKECGRIATKNGYDEKYHAKVGEPHHLMLMVTEISEAMEAWRDANYANKNGVYEELADCMIRIGSFMAKQTKGCNNFGQVVVEKMECNEKRPKNHGRKRG